MIEHFHSTKPGTVIVTGAAGFVGSHLVERLAAAGRRVVGIDNFCDFYDPALKRANAAVLARFSDVTVIEADIRDRDRMIGLFSEFKPGTVVHLAAMAGVRPSISSPDLYADVNVTGTTNVLDAAVKAGANRFIFASSSSVYGNASRVPFSENDRVDSPVSPYAATKAAGELLCATWRRIYGLPVTSLRLFTVFGPRQRPDLAINRFLKAVSSGRPIQMFGDGKSSRDYTFVNDIVSGIMAAIETGWDVPVINLGGSSPVSLAELVDTVERVTGRKAVIERLPMQPGDVERTWADLSRAASVLGYFPKTGFEEGVRLQWEWMSGQS